MATNLTLTIIKPDAVSAGHTDDILDLIKDAGFNIKEKKEIHLSHEQVADFYKVHMERPFYNDLLKFMSSGPVVAALLEKENAIDNFRELIGATDPADSKPGTIRNKFGTDVEKNAVHGSDSDANAVVEGEFFFPGKVQG